MEKKQFYFKPKKQAMWNMIRKIEDTQNQIKKDIAEKGVKQCVRNNLGLGQSIRKILGIKI